MDQKKAHTGLGRSTLALVGFMFLSIEHDPFAHKLTDKGKATGAEFRVSKHYGPLFLWSMEIKV